MSIPPITQLVDPPSLSAPATFDERAESLFTTQLPNAIDEMNTSFAAVDQAVIDAQSAATGSTLGTSATSVAIGTGSKGPFTTQSGKNWAVGSWVSLASAADPANYMIGQVTAYSGTSLTVNVPGAGVGGSGTKTDWIIALSGTPGSVTFSTTSRVLGRKTAGSGAAEELTLPEVLDFIGSAARGDILYRGSSAWQRLAAGTAGQVFRTAGAGADPAWGHPGMIQIGTAATTSGSSVTFSSISQSYNNLLLLVKGISHNNGSATTLNCELGDGSSYATAFTLGNNDVNSITWYGALHIPGYALDAGELTGGASSGLMSPASTSISSPTRAWRVTGGIRNIRLSPAAGSFDAGSAELWAF